MPLLLFQKILLLRQRLLCQRQPKAPRWWEFDKERKKQQPGLHIARRKNKQHRWEKNTQSIQRRRKNAKKAQKWADLIGVQIKTTDDPTLQLYTTPEKNNQPKWLVIRK